MFSDIRKSFQEAYTRFRLGEGTPELVMIRAEYFDSRPGDLHIEASTGGGPFSRIGSIAMSGSFKWRKAEVVFPAEEYRSRGCFPAEFRVARGAGDDGQVIVFSSLAMYAGYRSRPDQHFIGSFGSAGGEGWTKPFLFKGKSVFASRPARGASYSEFSFEGASVRLRTVFSISAPPAAFEPPAASGTSFMEEPASDEPEGGLFIPPCDQGAPEVVGSGNGDGYAADLDRKCDDFAPCAFCAAVPVEAASAEPCEPSSDALDHAVPPQAAEDEAAAATGPLEGHAGEDAESEASSANATAPECPKLPAETIRGFYASASRSFARLTELDPAFHARIVETADSILAGTFEACGRSHELPGGLVSMAVGLSGFSAVYESPVNAHADIWAGPEEHPVGDVIGMIQLSKCAFLVWLALAWRMTGNGAYLKKFTELVGAVTGEGTQNPPAPALRALGPSASAQRAFSLALAADIVGGGASDAADGAVVSARRLAAADISSSMSVISSCRHASPAESATAALSAHAASLLLLLHVGEESRQHLVSAMRNSAAAAKTALAAAINPDGGYSGDSIPACYAVFQAAVVALAVSARISAAGCVDGIVTIDGGEGVAASIDAMASFILSVAEPDGSVPLVSEYFPEFLLPVSQSCPMDSAAFLQVYSFLRGDGSAKFMTANHKVAEIYMIFGEAGLAWYEKLGVKVPGELFESFEVSGYCTARSVAAPFGQAQSASRILFDQGAVPGKDSPPDRETGLSHADLTSFTVYHGGTRFICDSGPSIFAGHKKLSEYQRSMFAHNVMALNRAVYYRVDRENGTMRMPAPVEARSYNTPELAVMSSIHDGYSGDGPEAAVRRTIIYARPYYILVLDDVFGMRKRPTYFDIEIFFHLSPDVITGDTASFYHSSPVIMKSRRTEASMVMVTHSSQKVSTSFHRGSQTPQMGWHSPEHGVIAESATIVNSLRFVKAPVRVYNLLYLVAPEQDPAAVARALKLNVNRTTQGIEVLHRDLRDALRLNSDSRYELQRTRK